MAYKYLIIGLSFIILSIQGCHDTKINPYEDETNNYSIYGALNLNDTEHIIRVRDLTLFHNDSSSKTLNAIVRFHDLEAGTSQTLRDSVVQFPAGYTHNFLLNKKLKTRTTYQVTVEGPNRSASSTFTTPGITEVRVFPIGAPISCSVNFWIDFENLLPRENIRIEIGFVYRGSIHWFEPNMYCANVEYKESLQQLTVYTTPLFLLNEIFPPENEVEWVNCRQTPSPRVTCRDLGSDIAYIRHLHLGPDWNKVYPLYPTDPLDIQEVADGLGFLGAYYDDITTYKVSTD